MKCMYKFTFALYCLWVPLALRGMALQESDKSKQLKTTDCPTIPVSN